MEAWVLQAKKRKEQTKSNITLLPILLPFPTEKQKKTKTQEES
jgi:hypothetical protein